MVRALLVGWLACLTLAGCTARPQDGPRTGILVVVRSDLVPPLARLELVTLREGGTRRSATIALEQGSNTGGTSLPLSFLIEAQGEELEQGVTLQVSGFDPDAFDPRVRRQARLRFEPDQILRFVVELATACEDRFRACEANSQTCGGDGTCINVAVSPDTLEPITPGEELSALAPFPRARPEPPSAPMAERDGGDDPPQARDDGSTGAPDAGDGGAGDGEIDGGPGVDSPCAFSGERCQDGVLYVCEAGAFVESRNCPAGCYEGADRCNECVNEELRCKGDWLQSCHQGFWRSDTQCDLGCSPLALACVQCIGPAARCGARGDLERCEMDGQWAASACYSGCIGSDGVTLSSTLPTDGGVPMNVVGDAAVTSDPPTCAPCRSGDLRCTGRDILSCDGTGNAYERGCHFGCADPIDCREETAIGQALLMTVL